MKNFFTGKEDDEIKIVFENNIYKVISYHNNLMKCTCYNVFVKGNDRFAHRTFYSLEEFEKWKSL